MPAPIVFSDTSGLGQGISALGTSLGEVIGGYFGRKKEKEQGTILEEVFSKIPEDPTSKDYLDAITQATKRGVPLDKATSFLSSIGNLEKAKNQRGGLGSQGGLLTEEEFDQVLDSSSFSDEQKKSYKNLYKNSTVGGRTAITKALLEDFERQKGSLPVGTTSGDSPVPQVSTTPQQPSSQPQPSTEETQPSQISQPDQTDGTIPIQGVPKPEGENQEFTPQPITFEELSQPDEKFEYPQLETFQGLTRTQRQTRENQLRKENSKSYEEAVKASRQANQQDFVIKKLNQINDSKKLPKDFDKLLLVNQETGELRYPGFANPETQEFVKIINDFTTQAKDTYGARVTNFELDRFMKRLPGLLNSDEGRRYILTYMNSVNKLNKLHADATKDVFNHYKISNITSQEAQNLADKKIRKEENRLYEEALTADSDAQRLYELKENVPKGHELVNYQGQFLYVPKEELGKALDAKATLL